MLEEFQNTPCFPLETVYMKEIKVSLSKMFYIRSASPFACYISHVQKLNFGNSGFAQNSQKKTLKKTYIFSKTNIRFFYRRHYSIEGTFLFREKRECLF